MKVECTKTSSPLPDAAQPGSSWIEVGREYVVISIIAVPGKSPLLQILLDDESEPGLFDSTCFRTSSTSIPSSWTAEVSESGVLSLGPQSWQRTGFWDLYFDRDLETRAAYDKELQKTLDES
jgi:hypothetical protein